MAKYDHFMDELDLHGISHIEHIYSVARDMEEWYGWGEEYKEAFTGKELEEDRLKEVFGNSGDYWYEEGVVESDEAGLEGKYNKIYTDCSEKMVLQVGDLQCTPWNR